MLPYVIIGAGPSGLATAKAFLDAGISFVGVDLGRDVGGLWNIDNPRSTVYESAHLISSKTTTEFKDFPMPPDTPDYPGHRHLAQYFKDYAQHFGLYAHYRFQTAVTQAQPLPQGGWEVRLSTGEVLQAQGLILANGTLSEPKYPQLPGEFAGEILHAAQYKRPDIFKGKRVLILGAGNSGCDIAVDAVHYAASVDISVRRGYYFVPKYVFGKPSDTVGGKIKLPRRLKQWVDKRLLGWFTGDPTRFGFPKPDYNIYESHPIVNTLILHHLGQGDLRVRGDIRKVQGHEIAFADGSSASYDLLLLATGYHLHYPFVDRQYLAWPQEAMAPQLYLNIFHPQRDDIFVLGMIEAAGIGWEGRAEQSRLVAAYIKGLAAKTSAALAFQAQKRGPQPDLSGGYNYLKLDRMAFYVHKDTYRNYLRRCLQAFQA